jgi:hypothetical protein
VVTYFSVKIAHLGVFLHTKGIVGVSANSQSQIVNWYYSVASGALKNIEFAHRGLGSRDYFKF